MDWSALIIAALNLIVVGLVLPLARSVGKIRSNELHHLQAAVDRIEAKLDAHIDYHLTKGL